MERSISHLLKILQIGKMDKSDFILISLNILEHGREAFEDKTQIDAAMALIKDNYLNINYHESIVAILNLVKGLGKPEISMQLIRASAALAESQPEELAGRRYFENKLAQELWKSLKTTSHFDSLDRFAKFMVDANKEYADGKEFSRLRKVENMGQMEMVISAMREFGEKTESVRIQESAMRDARDGQQALSSFKDRGSKRDKGDVGFSMNPGIMKASMPMPADERILSPEQSRLTDTFLINRGIDRGYSAGRVDVPFVNSVSGTTYTLAAALNEYVAKNPGSATLQVDINNIVQAYISFACMNGYHSLSEMMDVINSPEVKEVFTARNFDIGLIIPQAVLDEAIDAAQNYAERKGAKSLAHTALLQGQEIGYPLLLAVRVPEIEQTSEKVLQALRDMYALGKAGDPRYLVHKCRLVAQQYIKHSEYNESADDLSEVKTFIEKALEEEVAMNIETNRARNDGPV